MFLYSQDLSNYKTEYREQLNSFEFLYSQDLSNYKTYVLVAPSATGFCTLKI